MASAPAHRSAPMVRASSDAVTIVGATVRRLCALAILAAVAAAPPPLLAATSNVPGG